MAWDWSHANEAYQNAYDNIHLLDKETIVTCLAEFREKELSDIYEDRVDFGEDYENYVKELNECGCSTETLANELWEKVESLAICDNGGFDAWMCPYGCGCHKVSFSALKGE